MKIPGMFISEGCKVLFIHSCYQKVVPVHTVAIHFIFKKYGNILLCKSVSGIKMYKKLSESSKPGYPK